MKRKLWLISLSAVFMLMLSMNDRVEGHPIEMANGIDQMTPLFAYHHPLSTPYAYNAIWPIKSYLPFYQAQTPESADKPMVERVEEPLPAAADPIPIYTVKAGDTLYRIARAFNTSVEWLRLENKVVDVTKLQIGQKLRLPKKDESVTAWLEQENQAAISQSFKAKLTAYTAGYESTGKTPSHPAYGITSSGAKVQENHTIAVDPAVIPIGSLVYIEGIGIRQAEDTGSAIKGKRIDVYIPDLQEAMNFGVKEDVQVYVLNNKLPEVRIASAAP